MPKMIDETNKIYGNITIIRKADKKEKEEKGLSNYGACWVGKCSCGNEIVIPGTRLRHDNVTHCSKCNQKQPTNKKYVPTQNLIQKTFNHWTVIDYAKERSEKERKPYWVCQCDCNNNTIQIIRADQLLNNRSTKCKKCSSIENAKNKIIDLTGQRFGRLIVLKQDTQRTPSNRIKWICQCSCGNICSIAGESLKKNNTKSCGCLQKEIASKICQQKFQDLTNQTFGHLTALKFLRREGHHSVWLCQCDCEEQNLTEVYNDNLKNGHTTSCGKCKKTGSLREQKIEKLLSQNHINFVKEQTLKLNGHIYRFDFYVNNQYIVEFDGIGHFKATGGWNTNESVKNTQKRDSIKNKWCKDNNIPLIRIPYTHYEKLQIKDLLLETSPFIVRD